MSDVTRETGDGAIGVRPGDDRPLRVVVLSSARSPGLERLLERSRRPGAPYRVAGVVVSDPGGGALEAAREAGVPRAVHDVRAFHEELGRPLSDPDARERYDRVTVELLRTLDADVVVLCGYLFIVTGVLLDASSWRVINVHDADLTLTDDAGVPLYRGLRSTRDAIFAGEPETRSTVHLVTREVDRGPPLVRSRPFPVHPMVEQARSWGAEDLLEAYAFAQREWMMRASWGRLLDRTLELLAEGRIRVSGGRAVVNGELGPEEHGERAPPRRWSAAPASPGDDGPRRAGAGGGRGAEKAGAGIGVSGT